MKYASQIFQWFICRTPARPAPNYYVVCCMPYYVIHGWGQNTFEVSIKFRFVRGLLCLLSQLSVLLVRKWTDVFHENSIQFWLFSQRIGVDFVLLSKQIVLEAAICRAITHGQIETWPQGLRLTSFHFCIPFVSPKKYLFGFFATVACIKMKTCNTYYGVKGSDVF